MKKILILTITLLFLAGCTSCPQPEVYFCPDGGCKEAVMQELNGAQSSIYFMLYSFTDDDLGDILLRKQGEGVVISGIVEYQQSTSQYSQYKRLKQKNIPVIVDKNKALMHHKVWVIDGKTVITGSYNPTRNGDENNNENAVIIRDSEIASDYLAEFNRLFELWQ
jgi:phosphatidylserine/phosphatidylglycerophosphate/cardiolipin synthase-like enzyme